MITGYAIEERKIEFLNVSISLVFYIVASLMYEKYSAKLVTNQMLQSKILMLMIY